MFADSLLDVSWAQRARRSWTTLTSFALQGLIIGLLLLLPLWRTVGSPRARVVSTPISAGQPDVGPTAAQPHGGRRSAPRPNAVIVPFVQPGRIPSRISTGPDNAAPQPPGEGNGFGTGIGIPGSPNGFPLSVFPGTYPVMSARPAPSVHQFVTSSLLAGSLVRRVQPEYPPLAKTARIQGEVVLVAIISKAGTIEELQALSGHPMLVAAAVEAVRQWRYRPYILNREPVEVETRITVNFTLTGN